MYVLSEIMPVWKVEDVEPDVCDDASNSEVGTSLGYYIAMLTHCEKWVLVIVAVLSVRLASAGVSVVRPIFSLAFHGFSS